MLIAVNYHYIRDHFNFKYPSIFGTTPRRFRKQLEVLSRFGNFVSENDIINHLELGIELPERSLVVTFDDGLSEQYERALPILDDMGIPAIFFVNSKVLEENHVLGVHKIHLLRSVLVPSVLMAKVENFLKENDRIDKLGHYQEKAMNHYKYDGHEVAKIKYLLNFVLDSIEREEFIDKVFGENFSSEKEVNNALYMNCGQVKELANKGLLGSHSHEHYPIGNLSKERQVYQVKKSQEVFARVTGKKMRAFSYPYGSFEACKGLDGILGKEEFSFAFTMERALNSSLESPYYLGRFDNNDMPLGKAWNYGSRNPFEVFQPSTWF